MSNSIVWLSVDPVNHKVDFYPHSIATQIEKKYLERDTTITETCVLGPNFFNATINFSPSGYFYQTTPAISLGRAGMKRPGYRSVARMLVPENKRIEVNCKYIHNELRICRDNNDSNIKFNEEVSNNLIIHTDSLNLDIEVKAWEPEDLDVSKTCLDKEVVVWQWCNGVKERQGNLIRLIDEWWIPYLYEQNSIIENDYSKNNENSNITLPDKTTRIIKFIKNSPFAQQNDYINNKSRLVRRKIITVQQLVELINNNSKKTIDISMLEKLVDNEDDIPHEFYCCISQNIMSDPVKTIDGFTYDRVSIEKWFETSFKSPLTGLELSNKTLFPDKELKTKIEKFAELKIKKTPIEII